MPFFDPLFINAVQSPVAPYIADALPVIVSTNWPIVIRDGIAWGLMPVNPYRFRHGKWGRILVSFAGPAMNLVIAFVLLTILGFTHPFQEQNNLETFLFTGGFLNVILFALNLLPVPPLDGSNILANLSKTVASWYRHPQAQFAGLLLFFALIWSNMFSVVFANLQYISAKYALLISQILQ